MVTLRSHWVRTTDKTMELRIDRLLAALRHDSTAILAAIDRDPLLVKRESCGLVLANASKMLWTPQELHQLFAKGIVYRRDPYRLVSLPLVKIFNLGERAVSVEDLDTLVSLTTSAAPRIHFLRKWDGTMVQRFEMDGRVWFGTRGMLEGVVLTADEGGDDDDGARRTHFDYLGSARRLAAAKYPALLETATTLERFTLVLELIHPAARVITDYRGLEELVLLAAFDRERMRYVPYREVAALAEEFRLTAVDAFAPEGGSLAEQIDRLLVTLTGTDQEGTVLTIEHGDEVIYRVKIKSPDYLRLLKLLVNCTYADTVALLDAFPSLPTWPEFETFLRAKGSDAVPEEVLSTYREHYERFAAYVCDCERLRERARRDCTTIRTELAGSNSGDSRALRKAFALRVQSLPHRALLFAALDGRLDLQKVRACVPEPDTARALLAALA